MDAVSSPDAKIPVIDTSTEDPNTAKALTSAIASHGFAFVNGDTGFSSGILDEMFTLVCQNRNALLL